MDLWVISLRSRDRRSAACHVFLGDAQISPRTAIRRHRSDDRLPVRMTMLFEWTEEHASLTDTVAQSPIAFTVWLLIWALWVSVAVWRLIVIKPGRVRKRRLPSHHD